MQISKILVVLFLGFGWTPVSAKWSTSALKSEPYVSEEQEAEDQQQKFLQACRKIFDRGDWPVPFSDPNTRVELSDGEYYKLYGQIVKVRNKFHLKVDPSYHPWLSNRNAPTARKYLIDPVSVPTVAPYWGENVRIVAIAHGRIVKSDEGKMVYQIELEILGDPIIEVNSRRSK